MTTGQQAARSDIRQVLAIILASALVTVAAALILGLPTILSDLAITAVILFAIGAGGLAYLVPNIATRLR
ncbi:hypothetical protein [Sphingosinicella sp. BN140058]|uniref:hypothetical protein n=1 Tax=Sphingosinicella sp. BN140058 TaxID=1892855 RepID=UPI0010124680|nr:hypothetical protein [Sphingosinicella sp. BN140058]QAY77586.1 hypothetical protein ETR14_14515 [Sphingosinicella sp. BN140058]